MPKHSPQFRRPKTEGFAIICNAREAEHRGVHILALVDQNINASTWWTSDDPDKIMCYRSERMASGAVERLAHNQPRLIAYKHARRMIMRQRTDIKLTGRSEV